MNLEKIKEEFRKKSSCWDIASSVRPLVENELDTAYKAGQEEIFSKVGFLRQWLNERPDKLVSNRDILEFLK